MKVNAKIIIGWLGVSISLIFSSLWAYWGAIENFHEGWYSTSIWENVFMLMFQYLLLTIVFVLLAMVALRWKRIGLALHIVLAIFAVWFFNGAAFNVVGLMIVIPIIGLGLCIILVKPIRRNGRIGCLLPFPC
ncbi:MAG: hypothetical protein PHU24_02920 [Sphaerochaetaceae bacterium]|nr:hypothetical protein [Sphaerochaetaceae bacterium]